METWQIRPIENLIEKRLKKEFKTFGETKYAIYTTARSKVLNNIAEHIVGTEPFLTDHGPRHIANVLDNVGTLLGDAIKKYSAMELYCLILSVLFHDIGNIFNRKEHRKTAAKVFDFVWPEMDNDNVLEECRLINNIIVAHSGVAMDGSKNTLRDVESIDQLAGQKIRLKELAAIVRFADELAEGSHRTSLFIQKEFGYPVDSEIHHRYSNITSIMIDRGNKRIALNYTIRIKNPLDEFDDNEKKRLTELLKYTYYRIIKLNQERQYSKFYCEYLPFKDTSISLNIQAGPYPDILNLPKLYLNDLVVPGDKGKDIYHYNESYRPENILDKIEKSLKDARC